MQSSNSKPQFGPWLLDQVHSGQYEGLAWVDNNKFRIPWKHNSRKDVCDEDCKIFKAWAEASGKIRENPNDKAKWKTNFRCALYSLNKHFRKFEDHSKVSDDPHKVYQVLRFEYNYEAPHVGDIPMNPDGPLIEDLYTAELPVDCLPEDMQQQDLLNHMDTLTLSNQQPDAYAWDENIAYNMPAVQNIYPNQPLAVEPQVVPQNNIPTPVPQPYSQVNPDAPLNQLCTPSMNDLEVTVQYRSREVLRTTVSATRVQLHHNGADPQLQAHPLCFPGTESLLDRLQIEYTLRILGSLQRGLLLEVRDTGIYGVRLDKCHVFASSAPSVTSHHQPRKLPQQEEVQLLSFEKYIRDLKDFQEHRQGSPDYAIYLCFGEKFPDKRPRERKLITVKVVPLICRFLHERAQIEGASSLQGDNISLQISHNSLYDLIHSAFGIPSPPLNGPSPPFN
ncbi:hypothetical protein AAFF_G00098540 [Aldrovandia affinis]|uniref:IRF tryptophan pentad repeat domain-containing protein n=1 Tax=Aldrovandia affinis TaxID=143900 RepID=A0AAD7RV35_9TELE|nr:hypothetical protein AAFF_G00098540 [Aldrovandia affinis]